MHSFFKKTTLPYLLYCCSAFAQNRQNKQNNIQLINQNDILIGINNLSYANGIFHSNYDITVKKENTRYLLSNEFLTGNIVYDSQHYYNLSLNYDIYKDELVYIPDTKNNYIKINLIKKNISFFSINNKNFKNLQFNSEKLDSGFYEELKITNSVTLYVKHLKERKEVFLDQKVVSEFHYRKRFVIQSDSKYYPVKNKKDIILIFPSKEDKINNFYKDYEKTETENNEIFLTKLIQFINI